MSVSPPPSDGQDPVVTGVADGELDTLDSYGHHERMQFDEQQAERNADHKWKVEKLDHERNEFETFRASKMKNINIKIAENEALLEVLERERRFIREGNQDVRAEKELTESLLKKNIQQLEDIKKAREELERLRKDKGGLNDINQELDAKFKMLTQKEKEMAKKEQ